MNSGKALILFHTEQYGSYRVDLHLHYLATLLTLFIFFYLGVMESVFHKLSLSQNEISYAMALAILLSLINIQLVSIRVKNATSQKETRDRLSQKVRIGVNLGGCVVPLFFALYLLHERSVDPFYALLLVMVVSGVVYPLSRVEGNRGLVINLFGAVVSASLGGVILGGEDYLVWAYMAAVLGTLIGGDLFHLAQLKQVRRAWKEGVFIGGAGLMDAIFLSGLFAMMMAEVVHQQDLVSLAKQESPPQIIAESLVVGEFTHTNLNSQIIIQTGNISLRYESGSNHKF
ncbi:MAG: DUF1614 domain-containing protein [Motiliproteus sp.]|nr:DUF1614 domain-containing protein [Motiliproteus sp.]MCW9051790.1 DUF1614 domain-containing protein [Motiliproteus sp.]